MKTVAILGGGVAGLAAAYRLQQLQPEWRITVYEKDSRLGGLAVGWRNEQFAADLGPHRIYTELPEIEALLPHLIAQDQMLTVQRRSELLLRGHFYRYPVKPLELLKVMGPMTMARLGASAVLGKIRGLTRQAGNYAEAMVENFGRGVYEMIVEPYTRKVWKIDPAGLSAEVARVRVSAGNVNRLVKQFFGRKEEAKGKQSALNSFSYIRGGVEGLVHSLEQKVREAGAEIVLNAPAVSLHTTQEGIGEITFPESSARPDYVISTLPITDLVKMLHGSAPDPVSAETAEGLVYIGLVLVALTINRSQFTPNSWIYFPEEHLIFNRSYEPRNFDPAMAPSGQTMVVFEVTSRWNEPPWTLTDDEIIAQVRRDAISTGLLGEEEIAGAFSLRVPHTYPLYTTDYQERLETLYTYLRRFPNLITTGRQGLFNHNNMDHSMLMGIRSAEALHQAPENPAARWYDSLQEFSKFRIVD